MARAHALRAHRLLELLDEQERQIAELSPERELELAVSGGTRALNASRDWTLELARAHAQAAIALTATARLLDER